MVTSTKSSKHYISHRDEPETSIVGVLEQIAPDERTEGRKIALVGTFTIIKWAIK